MAASTTDEQATFRAAVRQFAAAATEGGIRDLLDDERGYRPDQWQVACRQLGLAGLGVPESFGGSGLGPVELAIAGEELGYALYPSPFLGTVVLAGQALTICADEPSRQRWLPGMVDGSLTATVAVAEEGGRWASSEIRTVAEQRADCWQLTGVKDFVVDGHTADVLLVIARAEDGLALFAVDPRAADVEARSRALLDTTRRMARVELRSAPAQRVSGAGDVGPAIETFLDRVRVALAAEQIGGARRCLDMAVDYAGLRVQFDRPIGSFQAIKHQLADLLVEIESAGSAAVFAASLAGNTAEIAAEIAADIATDHPIDASSADAVRELPIAAAIAQLSCADAYTAAAKRNIQVHGGIGYTWEHDAHLFLRRAKSSQLLFGTPAELRERIAVLLATTSERAVG